MAVAPVLFVSYSGVLGGAERILLDCATRLPHPVVVACPEGPLAGAARDAGVPVEVVATRSLRLRGGGRPTTPSLRLRGGGRPATQSLRLGAGPWPAVRHAAGLLGLARDIAALVRRTRPAVVVAWGMRAVLSSALVPRRRRRGARVLAVHTDFVPAGAVGAAVRAASARADAVVALSYAIAAEVPGAAVLHPGVDLDEWTPAPAAGGPPRALVLGALVPWKAPHVALEVAACMAELHLDVAGAPMPGDDPGYVRALRERAGGPDLAGRVTFHGHVADPRALLAAADVLLHCAEEPYGLGMVEALASGRPVVAAAAGGALEILGEVDGAGDRGPSFPPHAAQIRPTPSGGSDRGVQTACETDAIRPTAPVDGTRGAPARAPADPADAPGARAGAPVSAAGRLYQPGDAAAAAAAIRAVLADPGAPAAARCRAQSAFDSRDSAERFARAVDRLLEP